MIVVFDAHERRMAARDDERHERRLELRCREEVRENVPFEMVDADERHAERKRKRLRRRNADEQRTDEAGPIRHGNLADV